jgi:hypothetical protein
MLGALILAFIIVVAIPVGIIMGNTVIAALLGQDLTEDAEGRYEGSELVDLSKQP